MENIKKIIISSYLAIFNILLATVTVLNSKFIYKFAIKIFNIEQVTGVYKGDLYKEYSKIIEFINNPKMENLHFDNFTLSDNAVYHFVEVRKIFMIIYLYIVINLIVFIILFITNRHKNKHYYRVIIRNSFIVNIGITAFIVLLSTLDFTNLFEYFHKIIFNNNYWLFDTVKDSIILALPENFFLMCTALILLISITIPGLLLIIDKSTN